MAATSRREFLAIGGLLVGFKFGDSAFAPQLLAAETAQTPAPARLDSWLRIGADQSVRVFTGKVDIGMGVQTALMQIVAEELDVAVARVELIMGDTGETPDQGGVGGSTSISAGAKPLRNAAAAARALLIELASARLGVAPGQLEVADGVIRVKGDASKSVSYGALVNDHNLTENLRVSGSGFAVNVEGNGKPKDPAKYKIVGQSVPRVDLPGKIFGRAMYSTDVRVPGMLHGRVIRPSGAGASLVRVDDSAAKGIRGYVQTVTRGNFVGVVAENEWAAIRARDAVKVTWSGVADVFPSDLYAHMRQAKPKASRESGRAEFSRGQKIVEASYEWPFQAHATMGPGCAVADFRADGITTVWSGAQKPHALKQGLAQMLGVDEDRVRVVWVEAAGSYGRAGDEDVAGDAALLSQAVGKPVRVEWSRADMTAWGGKGPAAMVDFKAALGADGRIEALEMIARAFSGTEIIPQANTAGNMLAGQLIGMPNTTEGNEYVQWGASTFAYEIPQVHWAGHVIAPLAPAASPMRAMHLRDPNGPAGTFAGESFLDELAAAAGADPIEFRLRHIKDPRMEAILKAVAERAGWETRPSPKRDLGAGRGIAIALRGGTYVATVAEVEADRTNRAIRVKRLVCAHDCGLIVNPEALRGTIQANLVQSMSRALKERVTFDDHKVTSVDWKSYPVARWADVPKIEVVLVNHPEIAPSGAGEPSSRPTAAAIANAVFDATGVRVRRAPILGSG